jgi:spore maturation protein CgeB
MKILLVYPGVTFSTADLANGYSKAFSKVEGIKLVPFHFEKHLQYHSFAQKGLLSEEDYNLGDVIATASDDLLTVIRKSRPDWVLFICGTEFPARAWQDVSQFQEDFKYPYNTAVILTESPYITEWERGVLERVDVAFTTEYSVVDDYRKINPNTFYLRHSYDSDIHFWDNRPKTIDMIFVATGFPERQRLLEAMDWTGINLELYGHWVSLSEDSRLFPFLKGETLENSITAEKYRESKLGLNNFRTSKEWSDNPEFIEPGTAKSLSPRCYEAMACGTLLLTDWREELSIFPEDSYVLWGDVKELEEKTRWYLSHDAERNKVIEAGIKAVKGNTFDARTQEILGVLNGKNRMC